MRWQKKTLPQANLDTALNMMSLVACYWFKKRAYDKLLSYALSLQFSCLAHVLLL